MEKCIVGKKTLTNEIYSTLYEAVRKLGRNFASTGDVIEARNAHDLSHSVWETYGWTREMRFLQRESPVLLLKNSLLLNKKLAEQAVKASKNGELFYQDKKTYQSQLRLAEKEEKAKKPLEKRSVLVLPSREIFQISKDKNFEVLRFLAGPKQAEEYLENLAQKVIQEIQFYLPNKDFVDHQENPFVQQAWFSYLADRSSLYGYVRNFYVSNRAFGVFESLGEAQTQKISEAKNSELLPYTNRELDSAIKLIKSIREGKIGNSELEEVLVFMQKLPRKK